MKVRCKHYKPIGEGIWIGGIDGRYACHIPHCNKKNDYCNYEDHRECEMYEEGI